ncbi:MAG: hypothetical protein HQM08_17220 [Candidatus Riflebacteria bacterium]|nr:hypothetical protein [Candidatus Riflebacteria bacterium]
MLKINTKKENHFQMHKVFNFFSLILLLVFILIFTFNSLNSFYQLPGLEITYSGFGFVSPGDSQDLILYVSESEKKIPCTGLNLELSISKVFGNQKSSILKTNFFEFQPGCYKTTFLPSGNLDEGELLLTIRYSGNPQGELAKFQWPVIKPLMLICNCRSKLFFPGNTIVFDFCAMEGLKGLPPVVQPIRCSIKTPDGIKIINRFANQTKNGWGVFNFLLHPFAPSGPWSALFQFGNLEISFHFDVWSANAILKKVESFFPNIFFIKDENKVQNLNGNGNSGKNISIKKTKSGYAIILDPSIENLSDSLLEIWSNGSLSEIISTKTLPKKQALFLPKEKLSKGVHFIRLWQNNAIPKILGEEVLLKLPQKNLFSSFFSNFSKLVRFSSNSNNLLEKFIFFPKSQGIGKFLFSEFSFPFKKNLSKLSEYFILFVPFLFLFSFFFKKSLSVYLSDSDLGKLVYSPENLALTYFFFLFSKIEIEEIGIFVNLLSIVVLIISKCFFEKKLSFVKSFFGLGFLLAGLNTLLSAFEIFPLQDWIQIQYALLYFFIFWLLFLSGYFQISTVFSKTYSLIKQFKGNTNEIFEMLFKNDFFSPIKFVFFAFIVLLGTSLFLKNNLYLRNSIINELPREFVENRKDENPFKKSSFFRLISLHSNFEKVFRYFLGNPLHFFSIFLNRDHTFNRQTISIPRHFEKIDRELDLDKEQIDTLTIFQEKSDYLKRIIELCESRKRDFFAYLIELSARVKLIKFLPDEKKNRELFKLEALLGSISHEIIRLRKTSLDEEYQKYLPYLTFSNAKGTIEIDKKLEDEIYKLTGINKDSFSPVIDFSDEKFREFPKIKEFRNIFSPLDNNELFSPDGKLFFIGKNGKIPLKLSGQTLILKRGKNFSDTFIPQKIAVIRNEPILVEICP